VEGAGVAQEKSQMEARGGAVNDMTAEEENETE